MKNKIYPFLLGLSCIVIVALVSFKNSEKTVEKEQMIIFARLISDKSYDISYSTSINYKHERIDNKQAVDFTTLTLRLEEHQKEGWNISFNSATNMSIYYLLEREKK